MFSSPEMSSSRHDLNQTWSVWTSSVQVWCLHQGDLPSSWTFPTPFRIKIIANWMFSSSSWCFQHLFCAIESKFLGCQPPKLSPTRGHQHFFDVFNSLFLAIESRFSSCQLPKSSPIGLSWCFQLLFLAVEAKSSGCQLDFGVLIKAI